MKVRSFSVPGIIEQSFVYAGSTYWARTRSSEYQVSTVRPDGSVLAFATGYGMEDGVTYVRVSLGGGRFGEGGRILGAFNRTEQAGLLRAELESLLRAGGHFERYVRSFAVGGKNYRSR